MNKEEKAIINNIGKIKVGDKFKTISNLKTKLGLRKANGSKERKLQDDTLKRYLFYKKTNKINTKGHISNEIVITRIMNTPKKKIDKRSGNNRPSKYINSLIDIILNLGTGSFDIYDFMKLTNIIHDRNNYLNIYDNEPEIDRYKYALKNECVKKLESVLKYLDKTNDKFKWDKTYKVQRSQNSRYEIVNDKEKKCISKAVKKLRDDLVSKNNNINNSKKTFYQLSSDKKWRNNIYIPELNKLYTELGYIHCFKIYSIINKDKSLRKINNNYEFKHLIGERMKHKLDNEKYKSPESRSGVQKWGYSFELEIFHNLLFDEKYKLSEDDKRFIREIKNLKRRAAEKRKNQ